MSWQQLLSMARLSSKPRCTALKNKDIYQWKTALTKRGFLPMIEREVRSDFVSVKPVEQTQVVKHDSNYAVPHVDVEHTLDDQACQCEHCHWQMEPVSHKSTEQLDIISAQVRVIRHR